MATERVSMMSKDEAYRALEKGQAMLDTNEIRGCAMQIHDIAMMLSESGSSPEGGAGAAILDIASRIVTSIDEHQAA